MRSRALFFHAGGFFRVGRESVRKRLDWALRVISRDLGNRKSSDLTLARSRHLLVEVTPRVEAANGCDAHAILHHLHALGFRLCLPSGAAKDVCYAGEIGDLQTTTKETWVSTDLMLAHVQRGVGHAFTNAALTYCEGERCGTF